jgi:hypothetical protein
VLTVRLPLLLLLLQMRASSAPARSSGWLQQQMKRTKTTKMLTRTGQVGTRLSRQLLDSSCCATGLVLPAQVYTEIG